MDLDELALEFGEVKGAREEQQSERLLADSAASDSDGNDLLKTIKSGTFEEIENKITPRALQKCSSKSLLMSMKVSFELRRLADNKGPDEGLFNQLANSVEEFTYCLLDPLRSNQLGREQFGEYYLDHIVDEAIDLDQKKFFTHPVVHDEMNRKWHGRDECMKKTWSGRDFKKSEWRSWLQLLLFRFWCILDLVFSPILFSVFSLLKKRSERCQRSRVATEDEDESHEKSHVTLADVVKMYLIYVETPYFKFVRDTLSYIVLVVLHYALCLSPSTIAFSGLEWAILVFFIGRYLVERKQIWDILQRIIKQRKKNGDVEAQSNGFV
ncbi:hypothetical protein OS493_012611 [Desmophyllum pertusum]|uniref:Uncharacterized protein n=1 Tax=Desmophyllum pertusum TaxID=174260 RepID=A0A9X0D025_9CNID|nr:hypothetical protein OS493_012611 [Desmophyllum pertusum]